MNLEQFFEVNFLYIVGGLTHREHIVIVGLVATCLVERDVLGREERNLCEHQQQLACVSCFCKRGRVGASVTSGATHGVNQVQVDGREV